MEKENKIKGSVKDSKKSFRFNPLIASLALEAGIILSCIGSTIGLGITSKQADKYFDSDKVQQYRQELVIDAEERHNSGEISDEEYNGELAQIQSKENDKKYADIVFEGNAEYQSVIKNQTNCRKATDYTYVATLVGIGVLGIASKLSDENESSEENNKSENNEDNVPQKFNEEDEAVL